MKTGRRIPNAGRGFVLSAVLAACGLIMMPAAERPVSSGRITEDKSFALTYIANCGALVSAGESKVLRLQRAPLPDTVFGQASPGSEPVKFWPGILSGGPYPHGQLAFSPDGAGVFWSAMKQAGAGQTIYWSVFDGKTFGLPQVAPFAASGNGGPAFSADGRRLYFSAELPKEGSASETPTAICYVEKTASGWSIPVPIAATIDSLMTKGQVSVARSGNIYFSGRVLAEKTPGVYVSRYSNGTYLAPERLAGPLANVPLLVDPWVDPEERFLLVSFPPPEGPPMLTDIGVCQRRADGSWNTPVRLGGAVNTAAFERFPSLSRDGKILFFIRSESRQFVGDQAHFYWVDANVLSEGTIKAKDSKDGSVTKE